MRIFLLLIFMSICTVSLAQNTEVAVQIDSITYLDTAIEERVFTIHYHVTNKTKSLISLVLNTKELKSNMYNSSSWIPSYRLFQNKIMLESNTIFNSKKNDAVLKKMMQDLESNRDKLNKYLLAKQKVISTTISKNIINSIVKLKGNETKSFVASLTWDKNRYHKHFDNEYYLDQKSTHYLDLFLYFNKYELKDHLLPEDLNTILEDATIATGWLYSNKMEINFKD